MYIGVHPDLPTRSISIKNNPPIINNDFSNRRHNMFYSLLIFTMKPTVWIIIWQPTEIEISKVIWNIIYFFVKIILFFFFY